MQKEWHVFDAYQPEMTVVAFTALIQEKIDACSLSGGTVILDRPGRYLINGLQLKSNVTLILGKQVVLMGSGDEATYPMRSGSFELLKNKTPIRGLFYGTHLKHVAIMGEGCIDGNYQQFILPNQEHEDHLKFYHYPRPMTIYLEDCQDVRIQGVTLQNAPFWTIHLVGCFQTTIDAIKIYNEPRMPNTDGIDIDRCKNTVIAHCEIKTGDDGICPKCTEETARYGDCDNLLVSDCLIQSQSSAIKLGSSSFGNFQNFHFQNIRIEDTNRGLAFQLRDPGSARNIVFEDIAITTKNFGAKWWGTGEPIFVTLLPRTETTNLSQQKIENIIFRRISCTSNNGIFLRSETAGQIENIVFDRVELNLRQAKGTSVSFDLRPGIEEQVLQKETLEPLIKNNALISKQDIETNYLS